MISFPFDSKVTMGEQGYPEYDRPFDANGLRDIIGSTFTEGTSWIKNIDGGNPFKITPNGMTLTIGPGRCIIRGTVGYAEQDTTLTVDAAGTNRRIDTVVLRWDENFDARKIDLYVVKGQESTNPVRPALTRNESVYELGLYDVLIPANSTSISNANITDTRMDDERCGKSVPYAQYDIEAGWQDKIDAVNARVDAVRGEIESTPAWVHHRNTYRGKYLGTAFTSAQKSAIQNGTFDDIYVGDYWIIGGTYWLVADIDYLYKRGVYQHHIVIIPNTEIIGISDGAGSMASAMVSGGSVYSKAYASSDYRSPSVITVPATPTPRDNIDAKIKAAFGSSSLITYTDNLVTELNNGIASAYSSMNCTSELMNELMVIGAHKMEHNTNDFTKCDHQLAIFALRPEKAVSGSSTGGGIDGIMASAWWLRDSVNTTTYALVSDTGSISRASVTSNLIYRPFALIG